MIALGVKSQYFNQHKAPSKIKWPSPIIMVMVHFSFAQISDRVIEV